MKYIVTSAFLIAAAVHAQTQPAGQSCDNAGHTCEAGTTCDFSFDNTSGYCVSCTAMAQAASSCDDYFKDIPTCDQTCIDDCRVMCNSYFSTPDPSVPPTATATVTPYGPIWNKWRRKAIYIEYGFDWANFDQEVKNAVDAGYNRIYIGFYMSLYGCQAACTAWRDLDQSVKDDVKSYMGAHGATLYLSIGGPGEFA